MSMDGQLKTSVVDCYIRGLSKVTNAPAGASVVWGAGERSGATAASGGRVAPGVRGAPGAEVTVRGTWTGGARNRKEDKVEIG